MLDVMFSNDFFNKPTVEGTRERNLTKFAFSWLNLQMELVTNVLCNGVSLIVKHISILLRYVTEMVRLQAAVES